MNILDLEYQHQNSLLMKRQIDNTTLGICYKVEDYVLNNERSSLLPIVSTQDSIIKHESFSSEAENGRGLT